MSDRAIYDVQRDSAGRLAAILAAVPAPHPSTVLDLGAYSGYMAAGLADAWGCHVVAVERHGPGVQHPGVEWVTSKLRPHDLERYDVDLALALSSLHHMATFAAMYWSLRRAADTVIVEATHPDERRPHSAPLRSRLLHDLVTSHGETIYRAPAYGMPDLMRPLVISRGRDGRLGASARVRAGKGSLAPAMPKFRGIVEALGYTPYPGSLNVWGSGAGDPFNPGERPYTTCESRFGTYRFWPARVSGLPCHLIRSPNGRYDPGFAELAAPVRLREALALADGDEVRVEIL